MTESHETGSLTQGQQFDRAVEIAGVLAECGVQELTLTGHNSRQTVKSRTVDLPSLLVPGVVITFAGTTISIFTDRIDWTTTSVELAAALRAASGR